MLAGLVIALIASASIGWFAQGMKGRAGAGWAILTFAVMVPVWFFLYFGTYMAQPDLYKTDAGWTALSILVSLIVVIPMAIIVATLPSKKVYSSPAAMKKCPSCAEPIRVQAIKCRYCGADQHS